MFGVSGPELLVIAAVALIAIRPSDLPRVLRGVGRQIRALQRLAAQFQQELAQALHDDEVAELRRQTERAGRDVAGTVEGAAAELAAPEPGRRAPGTGG